VDCAGIVVRLVWRLGVKVAIRLEDDTRGVLAIWQGRSQQDDAVRHHEAVAMNTAGFRFGYDRSI